MPHTTDSACGADSPIPIFSSSTEATSAVGMFTAPSANETNATPRMSTIASGQNHALRLEWRSPDLNQESVVNR